MPTSFVVARNGPWLQSRSSEPCTEGNPGVKYFLYFTATFKVSSAFAARQARVPGQARPTHQPVRSLARTGTTGKWLSLAGKFNYLSVPGLRLMARTVIDKLIITVARPPLPCRQRWNSFFFFSLFRQQLQQTILPSPVGRGLVPEPGAQIRVPTKGASEGNAELPPF